MEKAIKSVLSTIKGMDSVSIPSDILLYMPGCFNAWFLADILDIDLANKILDHGKSINLKRIK